MKLKTTDVSNALEIVKPGLAAKEIVEQSTSFAFIDGRVVTYNDEISISHPVKELKIEGAIKAEELYLFLKKVKKDEITLELDEGQILFKSGRTRAGFTLREKIELPLNEIKKRSKWADLPEDFSHYLKLAMGAASRDMSRPVLTAVHVRKDGYMEASDSYKILRCETGQEMPVDEFLLPATAAAEVVKLNPTKVANGDGWIHFQNANKTVISCRILPEQYPDPSAFFEVDGIEITFPDNIEDILDRASVFAKRQHMLDEEITVDLKKDKIIIHAKSDTGWVKEIAPCEYNDDPLSFAITYYLLQDILKETHTFILSDKVLKFEGAGWIYVSALRNTE